MSPGCQKEGDFVREEGGLGNENMIQTQKQALMSNEEEDDAICKRTRARYSLENFTLDDPETFLRETDDEEDIPNVDDEDEYRKFLAAVLQSGDGELQLEQTGNNDDDDEEKNDLDFEIELEEALETDDEESIPEIVRTDDYKSTKRRPLVPILPVASPMKRLLPITEAIVSSEDIPINCFTQTQIGELHCLIHDHLQLLIQVYSLCALDHSREHIGTQIQGLISEMLQQQRPSHLFVTGSASSVLDIVDLAGRYQVDVSSAVQDYRRCQVESGFDSSSQKVPLFPLPHQEVNGAMINNLRSSSSSSKQQSTKTLAEQCVALVHKDIANLAKRFLPLFKVSLFPHKAPPTVVANRILFTDAEDELLALGIMEYNSDWKAIKQRFLPCKGEHQIYVRQKNQRSSKASENPIKAVLRMKSSPLTPQEILRIQEGLKYFKYDWMSVWKFVVPYRDPSSLPRQWRTALGIQKSYKLDAAKKEKRRLYDNRRKSREQSISAKEDRHGASKANENLVGDEWVDNSSEAYLDEGFLAEWKHGTSLGGASRAPMIMLPYRRSRKLYNKCVVRLTPDLPPVNLPDSVRVISQSVFAKNQSETSSKTCLIKSGGSEVVGSIVPPSDEMGDQSNLGIMMEQEELSDSDEEMMEEEEHVEFECEEMDDSEGEEEEEIIEMQDKYNISYALENLAC